MNVEKNLESLKKELKSAEVVYYKILGAIEALEAIESEDTETSEEPKK